MKKAEIVKDKGEKGRPPKAEEELLDAKHLTGMTKAEKETFTAFAKRKRFSSLSAFLREAAHYYMETHP